LTGVGDFQIAQIDLHHSDGSVENSFAMPDSDVQEILDSLCFEQLEDMQIQKLEEQIEDEEFAIEDEDGLRGNEISNSEQELKRRRSQPKTHNEIWEEALAEFDPEFKSVAQESDDMNLEDYEEVDGDGSTLNLKFKMERDELEFPDEVNTPTDMLAKKRFSKYRGLESFVNSTWETLEDEVPPEYSLIYRFDDFKLAQKMILNEKQDKNNMDESEQFDVLVGSKITIHIKSSNLKEIFENLSDPQNPSGRLILVSALFPYERKVSLCHYRLTRYEGFNEEDQPIKSKEPLYFNCGFRRFTGRPVYSEDVTNSDKHKIEKFLHKGRGHFSIASMYARIHFGSSNVLVFKKDENQNSRLVATGTYEGVDPERLLIKRIILTGYPLKVNKRKGVVRFMFFHPDDIRWFMPVKLWTKLGLKGQIDEPLGTKGHFKCSFSGYLKHHDTVCMSLYKRQFPPFDPEWFNGSL
jgi:pre-rRNA-processing protein TSR1